MSYSVYEPSGVPWLGEVPAHWEMRRLRTVVEMRVSNVDKHTKENEVPVRLCNYVDVYKNDRITQQLLFMTATASEDDVERFRLDRNDVIITKDSETWNDIGVPALVTEPSKDLISGYHLAILRPRADTHGSYLFWALKSKASAYQFHMIAKGVTRYGLSHSGIQSVTIPLPPPDEQAVIARYLDDADQRIRAYVSAKERLIALLEEERQAIIHQAVTRGLDPNVKLKPSGVEWLGDVPEHWEVRRLKSLCIMNSGDGITAEAIEQTGTYPVYGGNGLRGYTAEYTHDGRYALIGRQGALCGNVHDVQGKFWASEHAVVASLYSDHKIDWFVPLLEAMNLNQYSISAAQPGLSVERVANLWAPVPPPQEQSIVGEHLAKLTVEISDAVERSRRQIELMEEYRTRLIADVVTGKLDVRDSVSPAETHQY